MRAFFLACCAVLAVASFTEAQRGQTGAQPALPPISLTCPHHPDVVESKPGTCPFCKMALVPVRLDQAWTCPLHPQTLTEKQGTCPICRRQLVPVTVSLAWRCPGSTDDHLERGTCTNGSAMVLTRTLRPHGDHNPRHGGQFFMASDNWHHVEGAYPSARVFRLYVYDDFTRPLPRERLRDVRARADTRERFDPATRTTIEESRVELRRAANGSYLEGRIEATALPANITAKVQLPGSTPEQRFDFTFASLTRDPTPAAAPRAQTSTAKPSPPSPAGQTAAQPAAVTPALPATGAAEGPDPALVPLPIPETVSGILEQLRTRNQQIAGLIDRGELGAVWVPAFQAKDLCLALEGKLDTLDAARREAASDALQRAVRLSWLLDSHGDTGNRQNVSTAYTAFSSAVSEVLATFASPPR
jgi:hypothetical protein